MKKRGQVSVEFITIFGFIMLMIVPLVVVFFNQSGSIQDAIAQNHMRNVAIKLVDKAETIYYLGEPSKTTIKANIPEKVEAITIYDRAIVVSYLSHDNNIQDIQVVSLVNLTGNISSKPGDHYFQIESTQNGVRISE